MFTNIFYIVCESSFKTLLKKLQKVIFGGCPFDKQVKKVLFCPFKDTEKRSATSFIYFVFF